MGKSNRIRSNRAKAAVQAPQAKKHQKNSQGMPSWLMTLITVAVTLLILASLGLSILASSGLPNRMRTSMKSENFTVNTNMMSYYFHTTYQNFVQNYQSSLEYLGLDTATSLKDQPFSAGSTTSGDPQYATWFDYFVAETKAQVTSMLVYLEEANARGITLTDEEKAALENELSSTTASMSLYYASANAYFSDAYGKGVSKSDVLKAMEYSTLASKAMNAVNDELEGQITDTIIQNTYNDKKKDFDIIGYSYYTFSVDYEAIAKETLGDNYKTLIESDAANKTKVLDAYKAKIEEAKKNAADLAAITDAAAFKKAVLEIVAKDNYDKIYTDNKAADSKGDVSDADIAAIKTALMAESVAKAMGEKAPEEPSIKYSAEAETGTAFGKTVPTAFAKVLDTVKTSLDSKLTSALATYAPEKATYRKDDEFSEWAFGEGRTAGAITTIFEDDAKADADLNTPKGYAYVSTYLLEDLPHADEEKTRNVAYALFSSQNAAEAAIAELKEKGTFDVAAFEEVVTAKGSTGKTNLENCTEGMLGSSTFDKWLFDDALTVGKYTETPLGLDDSTYCVAYYHAEGEPTWKVTVESSILNENFEKYYEGMEAKYAITVKDKSFKKIDA